MTYDSAGNLTSWNGATYTYDAFNQMSRMTSGSEDWYYFYTADDERIWMYKPSFGVSRWELRGLDNRALASYIYGGVWSRERQLLYRGGSLLAARTPSEWNRFHVDHLGTPRAVTNSAGNSVAYHAYYGFGEEATGFNQDDERKKFTGHERDLSSPLSAADDLDYMHARHYNLWTGRFLSTDPVSGDPSTPQSWNRYGYVLGSPFTYVDPNGLWPIIIWPRIPRHEESILVTAPHPGPIHLLQPFWTLPPLPWRHRLPPIFFPTLVSPRPVPRTQEPGCDIIPDRLFGPIQSECCALHDQCYAEYGCTWLSWDMSLGDPCTACNLEVIHCINSTRWPVVVPCR